MLPPTWVDSWASHSSRNGRLRRTETPPPSAEAAAAGAPVQLGSYPWGMFGTARDVLGVEYLLVAFYDEPDMVRDIMQT